MRVDLFDFDLPETSIALRPVEPRDAARMLVVQPDAGLEDRIVRDLPDLLQPGDALVLNDTKVIPSRLYGLRMREETAARVEIMLHKREGADRWRAFARPAKKLNVGDRIRFGEASESTACELVRLDAEVEEKGEGGDVGLRFSFAGAFLDEAIARLGELPLPPYIAGKRPTDDSDLRDYQTVYAKDEGAVAAPTAGLHFTEDLFRRLDERGITRHFVTLHVGAGTFVPVPT
jgi:S-adenosylmethionine:tRNA ribosyltransferase-isomerase